MNEKNNKSKVLYGIIIILVIGIVIMGILLFTNGKNNDQNAKGKQGGITMQDGGNAGEIHQQMEVKITESTDGMQIPFEKQ